MLTEKRLLIFLALDSLQQHFDRLTLSRRKLLTLCNGEWGRRTWRRRGTFWTWWQRRERIDTGSRHSTRRLHLPRCIHVRFRMLTNVPRARTTAGSAIMHIYTLVRPLRQRGGNTKFRILIEKTCRRACNGWVWRAQSGRCVEAAELLDHGGVWYGGGWKSPRSVICRNFEIGEIDWIFK